MISVEQIHRLENRIERALGMLAELRETNASLTSQLQAANAGAVETARKLEESESARLAAEQMLRQLRTDQEEIEATINRTLHQLDVLEVDLSDPEEAASPPETDPPPEADSPAAPAAAESVPAAEVAATPVAAEPAADPLAGEPAERAAAAPVQDAAVEEPADDADPTATTEGGAAPSREGAELDIF